MTALYIILSMLSGIVIGVTLMYFAVRNIVGRPW